MCGSSLHTASLPLAIATVSWGSGRVKRFLVVFLNVLTFGEQYRIMARCGQTMVTDLGKGIKHDGFLPEHPYVDLRTRFSDLDV